jgi:hypothetical protein
MNYRHEAIIDLMLMHPDMKHKDLAAYIGVTYNWFSIIVNSDVFKAAYAKRSKEHREKVSLSVIEKTEQLASLCLDTMHEQVAENGHVMPHGELRDTAQMALDKLGYSSKPANGNDTKLTVNIGVSADSIARARERADKVIDAKAIESDTSEDYLDIPSMEDHADEMGILDISSDGEILDIQEMESVTMGGEV